MTLAAAVAPTQPQNFQRVSLKTLGRFMLANGSEHSCEVQQMSPGDLVLRSQIKGQIGERVVLYVDHIGRIDGHISQITAEGFQLGFKASVKKRDRLAAKLTWLANRHVLNLAEDRRHERIIPTHNQVDVTLEDGRNYVGKLTDLSVSGAALDLVVKPAIGTRVYIGKMAAQVVRHFEEGIAVEFATVQRRDTIESFLRL